MCRQTGSSSTSSSPVRRKPGTSSSTIAFRTMEELTSDFARRNVNLQNDVTSSCDVQDAASRQEEKHSQNPKQQRQVGYGTIRSVFQHKGFAFINPDDGAGDVFLHFSDVSNSNRSHQQSETDILKAGMRVRFYREEGHSWKGRAASGGRARRATIVDENVEGELEEEDDVSMSGLATYTRGDLLAAFIGLAEGSANENNLGFKVALRPAKQDASPAVATAESETSFESLEELEASETPATSMDLSPCKPPPGLEGFGSVLRADAPSFEPPSCWGQLVSTTSGLLRADAPCFEPTSLPWVNELDAEGTDGDKDWAVDAWTYMYPSVAEEYYASTIAKDQNPSEAASSEDSTASGCASDAGDLAAELAESCLETVVCS